MSGQGWKLTVKNAEGYIEIFTFEDTEAGWDKMVQFEWWIEFHPGWKILKDEYRNIIGVETGRTNKKYKEV